MTPASSSSSSMYLEMQKPDFFSNRLSSVPNGCGIRIFPSIAWLNSATSVMSGRPSRRNCGTWSSDCQFCRHKAFGTSKK